MVKETYRPLAKCKYSKECGLYNNSILPLEVETKMCGRGQPIKQDYKPQIPEPTKFVPTEPYAFGPGGDCDAYHHYNEIGLISKLRHHVASIKEAMEKQGFW